MKIFLNIITFCSFLTIQLTLKAMHSEHSENIIQVIYENLPNKVYSIQVIIDDIETFSTNMALSTAIMKINKDNLIEKTGCNSLELLNMILNTNLIKRKNKVNHNWNQENLNTVLAKYPNIQEIKIRLLLISYYKDTHKGIHDLCRTEFKKTTQLCSEFIDALSKELRGINTNGIFITKAQKLDNAIKKESNKPNIPWYLKYPLFGYYYLKFYSKFIYLNKRLKSAISNLRNIFTKTIHKTYNY